MSKKINISIRSTNLAIETLSAGQLIADMYKGWCDRDAERRFNQWVYNSVGGVCVIDVGIVCESSARFDNETGVHRITRISPSDPLRRRYTSFIYVISDGSEARDNTVRHYILDPYEGVKDVRTGIERADVQNVLDGDIDMFLK